MPKSLQERINEQEVWTFAECLGLASDYNTKVRMVIVTVYAQGKTYVERSLTDTSQRDSDGEPAIHLIEGPVGAGKSTFAGKLALELGALHIDLDAWMVTLFRPDRPDEGFIEWYADRKQRCLDQIWQLSSDLLAAGNSVVLELGLVQRALRAAFYAQVDITDHPLCVYWLDVPEAVRWQRVQERNTQQSSTYKMTVSEEIFALANRAWEAPDEQECEERNIKVIS